jgi:hypothetical protein
LAGRLGGATWWLRYCPRGRKASDHCVHAKQIRIEQALMERHSGESRKGAPQRGTRARTAGSEENCCVIALEEESQRPVRALKSKYEQVNNGPGIHGARAPQPLRLGAGSLLSARWVCRRANGEQTATQDGGINLRPLHSLIATKRKLLHSHQNRNLLDRRAYRTWLCCPSGAVLFLKSTAGRVIGVPEPHRRASSGPPRSASRSAPAPPPSRSANQTRARRATPRGECRD